MNSDEHLIFQKLFSDHLKKLYFEKENLGINSNGYIYHIIKEHQDRNIEYKKTQNFLNWVIQNHPKIISQNSTIEFINYGDTELVYVINEKNEQKTLLVGQPCTTFGEIKKEYQNLKKLYIQNPALIVCPIYYFSKDDREAYLTPYLKQARCIASKEIGYGSYIPDPYYHFLPYNENDEYLITSSMVANIVSLYDEKENLGLACCKIGGGDFILEKEYDLETHTIESTLKRMHLIAARKRIKIEFKEYLELLRSELAKKTYYQNLEEKDPNIIINQKNRIPMTREAIEDGISLGLKLKRCL